MPQVEITIGGRSFEVACQEGEEAFLISAARMLDTEASALSTQIGRMPEGRMLLMAGLMLADKTAGLEDRLREAEAQVAELSAALAAGPQVVTERVEVTVEVPVRVPVVPEGLAIRMAELAAEAEALAEEVELRKAKPGAPA
jgi:cell division protein ZapA